VTLTDGPPFAAHHHRHVVSLQPARMGHSATWLAGRGRLLVAGGSDGLDLLRTGHEFRDLHLATLTLNNNQNAAVRTTTTTIRQRQGEGGADT
jgi:hypothetical protein